MPSLLKRLIFAAILALSSVLATGCEEEPKCAEACLHACEICGGPCSPEDQSVIECTDSCENAAARNSRVDCVLETQSCDDLWRC